MEKELKNRLKKKQGGIIMNEKLKEALKRVKIRCHPKVIFDDPIDADLKAVEQALKELDDIKNSKPNEALECLEKPIIKFARTSEGIDFRHYEEYDTIKNYILKAQENEKEIIKYKQLEEDLGCSLDVVFKALQNGANYEDVANRMRLLPVDLHFNLDGDYVLYFSDDEHLLTKNYKKTWWLKENKEE